MNIIRFIFISISFKLLAQLVYDILTKEVSN